MYFKKIFNGGTTIAAWVGLIITIAPYIVDLFHPKMARLVVTPIAVEFNKTNFAISNLGNLPGILEEVTIEVTKDNGMSETFYLDKQDFNIIKPNETRKYEYNFDHKDLTLPTSIPEIVALYFERVQPTYFNRCFIVIEYKDIQHPVIISRATYPCEKIWGEVKN